jgi:ribose-phosphate pyrophosphokinase
MPFIQAEKIRDPNTGAITSTKVNIEKHVGDKNFLIMDDICDGGRTFIELAKVLRPLTTGKIMLYVTHGIFSAGLEVFLGYIDEIYCANSWLPAQEITQASNGNIISTVKLIVVEGI